MKDRRKSIHHFLEQRFKGLRRDVAAGKSGAAGGDNHVDVVAPSSESVTAVLLALAVPLPFVSTAPAAVRSGV